MLESYIRTGDGKEYVDANCGREALGIVDEHVDIFGVIKKLREERDELKEKCDRMKRRANATYGVSCGYSASKQPAFLCNVISYSWELAPIEARSLMDEPSYCVRNDSIHVELTLTPTANYKGTFDLEDLKKYIQEYGREKKLGIVESVDYQNAKVARAELASLYKTVLGKEKLDRDLSPHEIMKAILDEYERREDFIRELACSLGFSYPVVKPDTIDQKERDILERVEKLKDSVWPCENSSTFAEHLRKEFPKFCERYNVTPLTKGGSVHNWIQYIFGVLAEYRDLANKNFNKAEGFRKEKRAAEDSLAELRAKVREIYRSVFCDCRWEVGYSHCSALNDINEEYKRVKDFFKEKNDELKETKEKYSRYCLAVGSLCNIPDEHREDISWIEDAFNHTKKDYLKWKTTADKLARLRSDICTALCLGGETYDEDILKRVRMTKDCHDALCKDYTELRKAIWEAIDRKPETLPEETARLVGEVTELARGEKLLIEFRDAVAKAIGMEYPTTNQVILNNVQYIYKDRKDAYDIVAKLHDHVTELEKQVKGFTKRCDSLEDLQRDLWKLRKNAIEDLKSRGFCFRPEENETLPEIYDKLLKRYDWAYGGYKEQYRLRQAWHVRWESENERANGEHKRAEKLKNDVKCWTKRCNSLQTALNNSQNDGVALQAFRNECKKLREEKTKVISALGQDIWDDCLK